jgi:hypothetical protein
MHLIFRHLLIYKVKNWQKQKTNCCIYKIWIFSFSLKKIIHGSTLCNLKCDHLDLVLKVCYFPRKIYKFHNLEVLDIEPFLPKQFQFTCTYISKAKI